MKWKVRRKDDSVCVTEIWFQIVRKGVKIEKITLLSFSHWLEKFTHSFSRNVIWKTTTKSTTILFRISQPNTSCSTIFSNVLSFFFFKKKAHKKFIFSWKKWHIFCLWFWFLLRHLKCYTHSYFSRRFYHFNPFTPIYHQTESS